MSFPNSFVGTLLILFCSVTHVSTRRLTGRRKTFVRQSLLSLVVPRNVTTQLNTYINIRRNKLFPISNERPVWILVFYFLFSLRLFYIFIYNPISSVLPTRSVVLRHTKTSGVSRWTCFLLVFYNCRPHKIPLSCSCFPFHGSISVIDEYRDSKQVTHFSFTPRT